MLCVGQQKKKIEKKPSSLKIVGHDIWIWDQNFSHKSQLRLKGSAQTKKLESRPSQFVVYTFFPVFFSFAQLTFAYSTSFGNWFCLFLDLPCLEFWSEWFNIPLDREPFQD